MRRWQPLQHLVPAWYAVVMGLCGLALAWQRAVPTMGEAAGALSWVLGVLAALVFLALAACTLLRWRLFPQAWADDCRHPVRHAFVAALPIAVLLLATVAVAGGLHAGPLAPLVEALWWAGALAELGVTVWVLSRWWRGGGGTAGATAGAGLGWASVTPALFIPIVGNVLVPLAGVPLGRPEWAAAQFGIGLLFWPVLTALLLVRVAVQGLWPERLMPAAFILVAPPAVVGLALLQFGAPPLLAWSLWGMALFCLLWVLALMPRIVQQPFGLAHWGMSFPLAAFTALSLRLAPSGWPAMLAVALLAVVSLLIAALSLATLRGLRDGSLLAPETVPLKLAVAP
ncbi:Tellurite resistance protein-like permease [Rubrivivax sp. A210]|uniref:SLAC1 anion channel family protein n=1 Tax=Rubrivivax sp. A210 TaxID=2772301 RepID=UPI0019199653|nr:SLAC1 anion channel family protein [Rubrivivax sp. A210]CAD5374526.1 Tellurite resistance protein-like permease [Rubrivivax sp. A210]